MSDETEATGDGATAGADRAECGPCRGTGEVISNLGGEPKTVPCPWCDGTGRFIAGHDAQGAEPEQPSE